MAIDYWQLARDFTAGDYVQMVDYVTGDLSPYMGRVVAVQRGLGTLDVQWPFGAQRHHADEVVRVQKSLARYLPPTLDQVYSAYDVVRDRKASNVPEDLWMHRQLPPTFYRELAASWHQRKNEVVAYDMLYRNHGNTVPDEVIRAAVEKFYRVAHNLSELRIQGHATKTAAYWFAENRTYRATKSDIASGKPCCPKCGTKMKRTTYKMDQGARVRLFACPKDLTLIRQTDILGPEGAPVEW